MIESVAHRVRQRILDGFEQALVNAFHHPRCGIAAEKGTSLAPLRPIPHVQPRLPCFSLKLQPRRQLSMNLDPEILALLERAQDAAQHSYSPYSRFKVGAALRLASGEIVTGTNVENTSYGLTICAERSALVRAVAEFGPGIRIAAIAVANLNNAPSPPCGACRQVLAEFVLPDASIAFPLGDGPRVLPFSEILPFAFDLKLT